MLRSSLSTRPEICSRVVTARAGLATTRGVRATRLGAVVFAGFAVPRVGFLAAPFFGVVALLPLRAAVRDCVTRAIGGYSPQSFHNSLGSCAYLTSTHSERRGLSQVLQRQQPYLITQRRRHLRGHRRICSKSYAKPLPVSVSKRRTEVRPILSRLAMANLLRPSWASFRNSCAFPASQTAIRSISSMVISSPMCP